MSHLFIFGLGYSASRLTARLQAQGWRVDATGRIGNVAFDDWAGVESMLASATHILSSVPPTRDGTDPVLLHYGEAIRRSPARWTGYLSSTGVYGDTHGAWVDESASTGGGRRTARAQADLEWQALRTDMRVFRLPGIYGPGRSALDRVREGRAHRIDIPGQVFSRVHVDDIVGGVTASFRGPPGVYNLSDDLPCSQNRIIEAACRMLNVPSPPLLSLEDAKLSPMARAFYDENRRVANGKAKRVLDWKPLYPDYEAGLMACLAEENAR